MKVENEERDDSSSKLIIKTKLDDFNQEENIILDTAAEMNIFSYSLVKKLNIGENIEKTNCFIF